MHPVAAASSAVKRAYICRPCLKRLAISEARSLLLLQTRNALAIRPFSSTSRALDSSRVDETPSGPIEPAPSSNESHEDQKISPKSQENQKGKVLPTKGDKNEAKGSSGRKVGAGRASLTRTERIHSRSSSKKSKEEMSKGRGVGVSSNSAQSGDKANQIPPSGELSQKGNMLLQHIEQKHSSTRIRLNAWRKQREELQSLSRRKYHKWLLGYDDLKSRLQTLEDLIDSAMNSKYPSGTEQHKSLLKLASKLKGMAQTLGETPAIKETTFNVKTSVETSTREGESKKEAAGHTTSPAPKGRLRKDAAPRDFGADARRAQALRKLIIASRTVSNGRDADLPEQKKNDDDSSAQASAMQTILAVLPRPEDVDTMTADHRKRIYKAFRALVPELKAHDYSRLLHLFSQHVAIKSNEIEGEADEEAAEKAEGEAGISFSEMPDSMGLESALKTIRSAVGRPPKGTKPPPPKLLKQEKESDAPLAGQLTSLQKELIDSSSAKLEPIYVEQAPVRPLAYGLDRVLFNPGVYTLQDKRSRVYNFDPYLEKIMPVQEFNFDLIPAFTTSSKDKTLLEIANKGKKKYMGSSSSMTGMLSHFHFLLSRFRPITMDGLSRNFSLGEHHLDFTSITKAPASVMLRWKQDQGIYAIDSDKIYDEMNVLSLLGNSLERLLTLPTEEYERFRIGSTNVMSEEEQNAPDTYHYTGFRDILLRSQLDAHDPRLPGSGMFDLKTRAVLPVRMDVQQWAANKDYEVTRSQGQFESFERETADMVRATMLKYMLQVRIGRMDGIFVAYHNTERIFGFQYFSVEDLDLFLHGQVDRTLGDEEFKLSLDLLNTVLNKATERFPESSINLHFATSGGPSRTKMHIFAEPYSEEAADQQQNKNAARNKAIVAEILSGKSPTFDANGVRVFENEQTNSETVTLRQDESGTSVGVTATAPTSAGEDVAEGTEAAEANEESEELATEDGATDSRPELSSSDELLEDIAPTPKDDDRFAEGSSAASNGNEKGDGDSQFLDSIDAEDAALIAQSSSPLLAMELTIQNHVNGRLVLRPGVDRKEKDSALKFEEISKSFSTAKEEPDKWTVSYDLKEIKDQQKAWSLYLQTKMKRKTLVDFERDQRELDFIRKVLSEYVEKGRIYRAKLDEREGTDESKVQFQELRSKDAAGSIV